jgi:hypothetical protein
MTVLTEEQLRELIHQHITAAKAAGDQGRVDELLDALNDINSQQFAVIKVKPTPK